MSPLLRRLLTALAVAAASGTVAADPNLLDRATAAFADLRLADADQLLNEAGARQQLTQDHYYLRARVAILQGRLEQARSAAEACLEARSTASKCHEVSGETALVQLVLDGGVFGKIGAARRARKSLQRAVEHDPDNVRARLLLVRFYSLAPWLLGGSEAKARQQIEACRARGEAWGREAQALYDLARGDTAAAVEGFAAALTLRPQERDPALLLAKAYIADEQPEAAIDTLEQLVTRYPRFQEAWLELGKAAAASGLRSVRGAAALEHYLADAEGESQQRQVEAVTALARIYVAMADPRAAVRVLRRAQTRGLEDAAVTRALDRICEQSPQTCSSS